MAEPTLLGGGLSSLGPEQVRIIAAYLARQQNPQATSTSEAVRGGRGYTELNNPKYAQMLDPMFHESASIGRDLVGNDPSTASGTLGTAKIGLEYLGQQMSPPDRGPDWSYGAMPDVPGGAGKAARFLTDAEVAPLVQAAKGGDETAKARLLDNYLPWIMSEARRYASKAKGAMKPVRRGIGAARQARDVPETLSMPRKDPNTGLEYNQTLGGDNADAFQEAQAALWEAVKKWEGQGEFGAYARRAVEQNLERALAKTDTTMPVGGHGSQQIKRLNFIEAQLRREGIENPTDSQIAARWIRGKSRVTGPGAGASGTGVPDSVVRKAREQRALRLESMENPVSGADNSASEVRLEETIGPENINPTYTPPSTKLHDMELPDREKLLRFIDELAPKQKAAVLRRLDDESMSDPEWLAASGFNDPKRAHQSLMKGLEALKNKMNPAGLNPTGTQIGQPPKARLIKAQKPPIQGSSDAPVEGLSDLNPYTSVEETSSRGFLTPSPEDRAAFEQLRRNESALGKAPDPSLTNPQELIEAQGVRYAGIQRALDGNDLVLFNDPEFHNSTVVVPLHGLTPETIQAAMIRKRIQMGSR